jgi:hypothetical protein
MSMDASAANEQFHTVVIRGDLPTIKKQYEADTPKDLPPADYWIHEIINDIAGDDRWSNRIEPSRFKVQHTISNGPCEFFNDYEIVKK